MFASNFKRNDSLLESQDSLLLVVDVQESFRKAIPGFPEIAGNNARMIKAAAHFGVPFIITEQYPQGLGATATDIVEAAGEGYRPLAKMDFSALSHQMVYETLKESKKRQILVAGVETHVCVLQSVLDLLNNFEGWVYCVSDATGSRKAEDKSSALERMKENGARVVTTEMALFEWIKSANHPDFKELRKLVL